MNSNQNNNSDVDSNYISDDHSNPNDAPNDSDDSSDTNSGPTRDKTNRPPIRPSGFIRPVPISNELTIFMDVPIGSSVSLPQVSRKIRQYVALNSLQDTTDGKVIHPDDTLRKLLRITAGSDTLTYYNLSKFLKHHFTIREDCVSAIESIV